MPWWAWLLVLLTGLLLAVGGWIAHEYRSIPPADRRPVREMASILGEEWRGLRRDLAENRAVRRRMDANARAARRRLYDEQFERTRDEIRRERDS
jgi:hypothetical protein